MLTVRDVAQWLLLCAFPALVICVGSPEIAPAASLQSLLDVPDVVDRESDSYTLDAFVWRDSQPLVITGALQASHPIYAQPTEWESTSGLRQSSMARRRRDCELFSDTFVR